MQVSEMVVFCFLVRLFVSVFFGVFFFLGGGVYSWLHMDNLSSLIYASM